MIKTQRLELVPFDTKYAQDLLELWGDKDVIKYTYTPQLNTIDECKNYIEYRIKKTDKEFTDSFVIMHDNKAIGMIGCPTVDKETEVFGFYYKLTKKNWGYGYATEAASAVKNYLLNKYPAAIKKAEAVSINHASIKVLQKIGLKQTSIQKNGFTRNGQVLDIIRFSNV
jgi:ribosomal-protein-alanine N-acetyltransferase